MSESVKPHDSSPVDRTPLPRIQGYQHARRGMIRLVAHRVCQGCEREMRCAAKQSYQHCVVDRDGSQSLFSGWWVSIFPLAYLPLSLSVSKPPLAQSIPFLLLPCKALAPSICPARPSPKARPAYRHISSRPAEFKDVSSPLLHNLQADTYSSNLDHLDFTPCPRL